MLVNRGCPCNAITEQPEKDPIIGTERPRLRRWASRGQLVHRDCQPAQIGVRHQTDLLARELQNSAVLVREYDRADAAPERKPGASRGVDASNIRRALDVTHPTVQHRLRSAEHQAVVYAADPKPIAAAAEEERAAAGRATDDPASLVDRKRDAAAYRLSRSGDRR